MAASGPTAVAAPAAAASATPEVASEAALTSAAPAAASATPEAASQAVPTAAGPAAASASAAAGPAAEASQQGSEAEQRIQSPPPPNLVQGGLRNAEAKTKELHGVPKFCL